MASPVFEVMFYGAFAENNDSRYHEPYLLHSTQKTLEIFLHDVTAEVTSVVNFPLFCVIGCAFGSCVDKIAHIILEKLKSKDHFYGF